MLHVGLTGGIGSGKSTFARLLQRRGAVVIDADALARSVVAPGTEGNRAVDAAFPGVVERGVVNRTALRDIVFADPDARRRLEEITHPLIRRETQRLVGGLPSGAVVVHDVPLLVEKGLSGQYDVVVVVEAPEALRRARLAVGRGMSEADISARIAAQATDAQRRAVADIVVVNDQDGARLEEVADRVWHDLASRVAGT